MATQLRAALRSNRSRRFHEGELGRSQEVQAVVRGVECGPDRCRRILDGDQHRQLLRTRAIGEAACRRDQGLLQVQQLGFHILPGSSCRGSKAFEDSLKGMTQDKRPHALLQERPFIDLHRSLSVFREHG